MGIKRKEPKRSLWYIRNVKARTNLLTSAVYSAHSLFTYKTVRFGKLWRPWLNYADTHCFESSLFSYNITAIFSCLCSSKIHCAQTWASTREKGHHCICGQRRRRSVCRGTDQGFRWPLIELLDDVIIGNVDKEYGDQDLCMRRMILVNAVSLMTYWII